MRPNRSRLLALIFSCGVCMFPTFTAVAGSELLNDFSYPERSTSVSQAVGHALIEERGAVVIDVRTPEEYAQGHVIGAYNFPIDKFDQMDSELSILKENDTPVLLYCLSGRRVSTAVKLLERKGYKRLMAMGGMLSWEYESTTEPTTLPFADAVRAVKIYNN